MQNLFSNGGHNTGSTKRQAPKPPSPGSVPSTPTLVQSTKTTTSLVNGEMGAKNAEKLESPLMNGMRNAVCFLGDNGPSGVKRRLPMESSVGQKNRNSVCVSMTPNGTGSLKRGATVNGE